MVDIQSPVAEIEIVQRSQLRHFIMKIAEQENRNAYHTIDPAAVIAHLEAFQVPNPYLPAQLALNEMKEVRGGIQCAHCGNGDLHIGRAQYIHCACGFSESRDKAVVRTVCEYGVLRYGEVLKLEELLPFFNGQVTRRKLSETLHKHFDTVHKNRYTYHINKKLPLEKRMSEFEFLLPDKLLVDNKEYTFIEPV